MNATPSFDECPSLTMASSCSASAASSKRQKSRTLRDSKALTKREANVVTDRSLVHYKAYCHSTLRVSRTTDVACDDVLSLRQRCLQVDSVELPTAHLPVALSFCPSTEVIQMATSVANEPPRESVFHPHTNHEVLHPLEQSRPRAGLRLLAHLISAVRTTSYGGAREAASINNYIERVDVRLEENALVVRVEVERLLPARQKDAWEMPDDLDNARQQLLRWFGPVVELTIRPVLSSQRTLVGFVDHMLVGTQHSSGWVPEEQHSCLHTFSHLYCGDSGKTYPGPATIILGLVVPEQRLLDRTWVRDDAIGDAHPFEPTFFQKGSCMFQFFNGDATSRTQRSSDGSARMPRRLVTESDVISAFSLAMLQRRRDGAAAVPPPQQYQPFVVRLPHHLISCEAKSTLSLCVGSAVTSLEHGLRPVSLPEVSQSLDQAIVFAVLRLLLTVDAKETQ